jgi:hypothetical protein
LFHDDNYITMMTFLQVRPVETKAAEAGKAFPLLALKCRRIHGLKPNLVNERCTTLAQFPYIGTSRDELIPALRSLPVGNYLIFYRPIPDGIEVVRVLPGMRDIDAFF